MHADAEAALASKLAQIVLDRARVLAPFVIVGVVGSLLTSNANNVPTPREVIAVNAIVLAVLVAVAVALLVRAIPERFAHAVGIGLWWGPVFTTLVSYASTGHHLLVLVLLLEISTVVLLVHTSSMLASFAVVDIVWIAITVRTSSPDIAPLIESVLLAQGFAVLVQQVMRRSLVTAETRRLAEISTARELSRQLAELRRSEQDRVRLHDQLLHVQRMEAVGTLAAGIAHDMNNVLASIAGAVHLLQEDASDESVRRELGAVLRDAERGAELTRGLLAFSRRGAYRKAIVSISTIVRDLLTILARTLPKTIEIRADLPTTDGAIDADATQIGQALVNLALNAAEAMEGAGILVIAADIVALDAAGAERLRLPAGAYVRLRVTDTGPGMDEATRARVFEPFFTTKAFGKGTGLGLSIVYGIAQGHGGTASVDSEPGAGTTFSIHLPEVEPRPEARPCSVSPTTRGDRKGSVLVIDDEPGVRRAHTQMLHRMGMQVLAAADGAEGLRVFEANADTIDLVVLDMGMPVMAGGECFRRLRTLAPKLPVLIVTGYAVDAEVHALVEQGAEVLEKPFQAKVFGEAVVRLLGTRPA